MNQLLNIPHIRVLKAYGIVAMSRFGLKQGVYLEHFSLKLGIFKFFFLPFCLFRLENILRSKIQY